jgi:O-antigen/teichoic acid export membrane protein
MLHILIGFSLFLVSLSLTSCIFDNHLLNITAEKIEEAKLVYYSVLLSVLFSLLMSPYRALLVAHENIVYISVIDVLDGVLKLVLVFTLFFFERNRLAIYAFIITMVTLFNFLAFVLYCSIKYKEACLIPSVCDWSNDIQKKLLGFTTWTLYGTGCIFFRIQGISVVLNRMYGTIMNTSYGIAGQVSGSLSFLSQAITSAVSPQIVKAAGRTDYRKMFQLSSLASKYSYFALGIIVIPLLFELNSVLTLWLGTIPKYSETFCQIMLVAALCDQVTVGLAIANQALGSIRNYSLIINSLKGLTVVVVWFLLSSGIPLTIAIWSFAMLEFLSALVRIPYMAVTTDINVRQFVSETFCKIAIPTAVLFLSAYFISEMFEESLVRLVGNFLVTVLLGGISIWFFGVNQQERGYLSGLLIGTIKKK